jgi:transcriptional regulator with XRE-family HTH domain
MTIYPAKLGQFISTKRKELGLSQKDLASRIVKEDGAAISPQYFNDIELGRRHPSSDHILHQFATQLKVDPEALYLLAGQIPDDIRRESYPPEAARPAFHAFLQALREYNKQ